MSSETRATGPFNLIIMLTVAASLSGCFANGSARGGIKSLKRVRNSMAAAPATSGSGGSTSSGGVIDHASVSAMPNAMATVQQIDAENPGLLNCDCAAFQRKVMERLRQTDKNWGYCNRPGFTESDRFMYGTHGPMADAVVNVCSGHSQIWWNPEPNDPTCAWGTEQLQPEQNAVACNPSGTGGGSTGGTTGGTSGGTTGGSGVPDVSDVLRSLDQQNPGMLQNNCADFLRLAVQTLQASDSNWGFCNKPQKNKVPADILMYRNGYLVDFMSSSCSPDARLSWQVMPPPSECTWGATADYPIPQ